MRSVFQAELEPTGQHWAPRRNGYVPIAISRIGSEGRVRGRRPLPRRRHPTGPPGLYAQGADPGLIADASKHRELTPIETGCNDWKTADSFDRMQDLANIQVPALIVAGTEDALTPAKYAQYLAAQIPDNELHILAGAGHMLVMECAAEIAALITGRF